jgi:hypothetical protein
MAPACDTETRTMRSLPASILIAATLSVAVLAGCPQERPGAEKEIPPQRVPPAVAVEPQPATHATATLSADGGVPRQP